jgi:predicted  nucleic acid-binding Zn-ribbon protein
MNDRVIDILKKELQKLSDAQKSDKEDLEEGVNRVTDLNERIKYKAENIRQIEHVIELLSNT